MESKGSGAKERSFGSGSLGRKLRDCHPYLGSGVHFWAIQRGPLIGRAGLSIQAVLSEGKGAGRRSDGLPGEELFVQGGELDGDGLAEAPEDLHVGRRHLCDQQPGSSQGPGGRERGEG